MEEKDYIEELIAGYLSGRLSTEESATLETWINASPENGKHFRATQEIWYSSIGASDERRFDKDKAYRRFLARTGKTRRRAWTTLWRSAAAAAILAAVSYASFKQGGKHVGDQLTEIKIEAPWGSRVKTSLPDGTIVWLNAESTLAYSQGFGVNDRTVDLSGEGYFEVSRNEKLPFSVQTAELQVKVLGTKFNFRNYADDTEAIVSLLEGTVAVSNRIKAGEDIIMSPDQRAFLDKNSGEMRLTKAIAKNTTEWTNGHLFFDEELLPNIAKELERSYDVKIILAHPDLGRLRFYSQFARRDLSIKEILDMLSSTGKIKYRIDGKEITLNPAN